MKPCEIESCPEGQEASGYDDCGCIEGCVEKCPDLVCDEECTVPNYETCSCDVDPDPCCGLEGPALTCCRDGLTCGDCEIANYETCGCEYDTSCCPEFNGCDGCTEETVDERRSMRMVVRFVVKTRR